MLGKLMKYEFAALSKVLPPLYGAVMILSVVGRLMLQIFSTSDNTFAGTVMGAFMFLYIFAIIASVILTFFVIVQRFYKSMVCDEGYLTHTLPVSPLSTITAKTFSGAIWMLFGVLSALAGIAILILTREALDLIWTALGSYGKTNAAFAAEFGISLNALFGYIGIIMLVGLLAQISLFYAAIAIGQLFARQKLLGSVAGYMIINTIAQFLSVGIMILILSLTSGDIEAFLSNSVNPAAIASPALLSSIILQVVLGGGCFLLTNWIMKRKLNLD